nr:hypothetical protein [Ilumatobacteraceae bacterium]
QELDGLTVLSVVHGRAKVDKAETLTLLADDRPFEPVTQQRATRDRDDRPRRPRRDDRGERRGGDRGDRGDRSERGGPRPDGGDRPRREPSERRPRRERPSFTPPPELPQRPKPKRLRPGTTHRTEVLASVPEEQRPIAELALQGLPAVRQRVREHNAQLSAEGKPPMPEATILKMAEDLLPRLRVADWLDRAEAAERQLEHLDLRDLRSVVVGADDPMVARDESTRELAGRLKAALVTKQEHELQLWFGDIDAALGVGRVIRALRLSSQPPKAGVPFPAELATRLTDAANGSLLPTDGPDRWSAVLEAAAFSPVRGQIAPTERPAQASDELLATVRRLAPALPQVATLFGIEVAANAAMPKPLRPTPRPKPAKAAPAPRGSTPPADPAPNAD